MGEKSGLDSQLDDINQQLERVSLREKDGRLYIRGRRSNSFPLKPGERKPRRVELALGVSATPAGMKVAIARAKAIDSQLLWGKFEWNSWLRGNAKPPDSIAEWVQRFEQNYWHHNEKTLTKERTFRNSYSHYFSALPQDIPLSLPLLKATLLEKSQSGSRSRQFYCMAYRRLAEFAAKHEVIPFEELTRFSGELRELRKGYAPEKILPENLPTDQQIIEIWQSINNPAWKWLYRMLAVYGLRPHEVFRLDLGRFTEQTEELRVLEETKTGARLVFPCPHGWREQFKLWDAQLPKIQLAGKSNEEIGKKVSQEFRERKIPHIPYALRHAWCIRTVLVGVPDSVAARWAGHSVSIHAKTYHQAISESQQHQVFEQMKKGDRSL